MKYKRIKNNYKIEVQDYDNKISITNLDTNEITTRQFRDHIIALTLAKQL